MNSEIQNLPVAPFLDKLCSSLKNSPSRFLILTAETAAGKSTAVPVSLLEHFSGKIIMLEPRRLAVTAIADRVSNLLGEETGNTVGYRLHLENKVSSSTRLEIVTEAILTRKLQADPLLDDINVIVIDEFHERSVHADLSLAFLKETMALRDDLFVLIMSATLDLRSLAEYCGNDTPVMKVPGRNFPVKTTYTPERSVVSAVTDCILNKKEHKTILVFLPGLYEINKTKSALEERFSEDEIQILILHSSIPLSEQRKILKPNPADMPPRVILSTSIAETSITVPDVTMVIDSGLTRTSRLNISLGMNELVTIPESQFSAEQRTGRAGRVQAGECVRLWDKSEIRPVSLEPEILRTDISHLVLECAQWGASDYKKLSWLTQPNDAAWKTSTSLLQNLGLIKNDKITEKGSACLKTGLDPRMASTAYFGKQNNFLHEALNLILKFSEYTSASEQRQKQFISNIEGRLKNISVQQISDSNPSEAEILLQGFPDRLARLTSKSHDSSEYQFPNGKKALIKGQAATSEWIIAPEVEASNAIGRIYSWQNVPESEALEWLKDKTVTETKTLFTDETTFKYNKSEIVRYGQIIISEKKLPASGEDFIEAVIDTVSANGLEWLKPDDKTKMFLLRCEFYCLYENSSVCSKLENLATSCGEWLKPFITSPKDLTSKTIYEALYWYLNGTEIDSKVPEILKLENGLKRKISYEKHSEENKVIIKPVLEIIIQQAFGCFKTPQICGQNVLLKLLSPARRPLQITEDLENFWTSSWIEICKEMKGRYPKHNWDYKKFIED